MYTVAESTNLLPNKATIFLYVLLGLAICLSDATVYGQKKVDHVHDMYMYMYVIQYTNMQ